jgi:hypothetical protein
MATTTTVVVPIVAKDGAKSTATFNVTVNTPVPTGSTVFPFVFPATLK